MLPMRSPIGLCSVPNVHQVLQRQLVQALLASHSLNDVPAKAIDVDPPTLGPSRLGGLEEIDEALVLEVALDHILVRKVDDGDLAGRTKGRHRRVPAVGQQGIVAWFGAGLPAGPGAEGIVELIVVFDVLEGRRACHSPSQDGRWVEAALAICVRTRSSLRGRGRREVLGVEGEVVADMANGGRLSRRLEGHAGIRRVARTSLFLVVVGHLVAGRCRYRRVAGS